MIEFIRDHQIPSDILDLIVMFIGFTYYFWGMSVGKFKGG